MTAIRLARSLDVEYPVENDPTKLHKVLTEDGVSMWRWECMCCGEKGVLHATDRTPRAGAIRHANLPAHTRRLSRVRSAQSAALEGSGSRDTAGSP